LRLVGHLRGSAKAMLGLVEKRPDLNVIRPMQYASTRVVTRVMESLLKNLNQLCLGHRVNVAIQHSLIEELDIAI
jgi:predicted metallo-beta-lactamase superfamily hydrolase